MAHVNRPYPETSPYANRNTSFLSKLTKGEVIWGIISIFFFFNAIGNGNPPVLGAIILIIIVYSVNQRDTTKYRLYNLIQRYPKSTVSFLTQQLDKDEDHIIKVLKIMILDEGAPIRLDLNHNTVTKVGRFPGEPVTPQKTPEANSTQPTPHPVQPITQPVMKDKPEIQEVHETVSHHTEPKVPMTSCIQCGGRLPVSAKYCHNCGVRQFQ